MTHICGDIDQLEDLFIFAEIGLTTSSVQQIDSKHIFNISKPVLGVDIVGIPISLTNFQLVFYGTSDNSIDGISFDTTQKTKPFTLTRSYDINNTDNGKLIKSYYNFYQDNTDLTDPGKYAWSSVSSTIPGLHFEERVLPVWINDIGCGEDNLSVTSLVRLKQELHSGEILNNGSYDIYGYNWGEFETGYQAQTDRTFASDVATANGANVAIDIMLTNSNSMTKNILLRVSYTVTTTGT